MGSSPDWFDAGVGFVALWRELCDAFALAVVLLFDQQWSLDAGSNNGKSAFENVVSLHNGAHQ